MDKHTNISGNEKIVYKAIVHRERTGCLFRGGKDENDVCIEILWDGCQYRLMREIFDFVCGGGRKKKYLVSLNAVIYEVDIEKNTQTKYATFDLDENQLEYYSCANFPWVDKMLLPLDPEEKFSLYHLVITGENHDMGFENFNIRREEYDSSLDKLKEEANLCILKDFYAPLLSSALHCRRYEIYKLTPGENGIMHSTISSSIFISIDRRREIMREHVVWKYNKNMSDILDKVEELNNEQV